MVLNPVVMALCIVLVLGVGTYTAYATSSGDDDDDDDDNSQDEETQQPTQGTQQSQVTWRTFNDREGLFTVQYPSNWRPSNAAEADRSGPIDTVFISPGSTETTGAELEFIEYEVPSVFSTPKESLEQEITDLQNDPTVTKFEIERPLECAKYTLNGLAACSYVYEVDTTEGSPLAIMAVDALAPDGTEHEVYYRSDFNSFEHFLPIVESMIRSFQTTGGNAGSSDFSLGPSTGGSNITDQQSTDLSGKADFSLGQ
jgi:hypothetical protein